MKSEGSVLLLVLMVILVLASISLELMEDSSEKYGEVNAIYLDSQAYYYGYSALRVVKRILSDDDASYDALQDDWNNLPVVNVEGGTVRLRIVPLNSKLSITALVSGNSRIREKSEEILSELLSFVSVSFGLEDIRKTITKYRLYSLKDLDFILESEGFSCKLNKMFTLDGEDKLNINFAAPELISKYVPEVSSCVDSIIARRRESPIKSLSVLREMGCVGDEDYVKVQRYMTVRSQWFYASVDVEIEGLYRHFGGLFYRSGPGKVKMVKYFEGRGCYE